MRRKCLEQKRKRENTMSADSKVKAQLDQVWQQALAQLHEVKDALSRSVGRIEGDLLQLRGERDRLLRLLGEQTYKLAHQGKVPLPLVVRRTVDRLTDVIDNLAVTTPKKKAPRGAKKTAAKKSVAKTPVKKSVKKVPRTAKKTSAKKVTKKKVAKKSSSKKKTSPR